MNIFWGIKNLRISLGVIKNWNILRGHFYAFKGQGTEWVYLFWLLNFHIFFGVLEIPDILG